MGPQRRVRPVIPVCRPGGGSGAGRLSGEGSTRGCRIEQLEPRLLLDTSGPQIVAHWPTGLVSPVDHVEITFNEPIAPATLTAGGVLVIPSPPVRLGGYDTTGLARGVALAGGRAYVADETAGLQVINVLADIAGVTKTGDASYRIDLPCALPNGEYRAFVGPEVMDLAGNAMDQNANGIGGEMADALGFSFTTSTASPAPAVPSVAGRHVFYNNSAWDVGNSVLNATSAASAADDADDADDGAADGAIATNVSALLPGQIAGPENRTAFSRGINGVMVDVANMFAGGLTAADFTFRVGAGGDASAWRAAPAPTSVTVRAGAGVGGGSRVTIIWPDGAIVGCWLEVTVLSDANGGHAGLGADDVFFFGNLPGDFNRDGSVNMADYVALKQAFGSRTASAGASADFDGSGAVDYGDLLTLMESFGQRFVTAFCPPTPALAPAAATPTASATAMAAPDPADAGQAPAIVNETDTEPAAAEPVASEASAGAADQAVLTADEAILAANQVVLTANDAVLSADQSVATTDDRGRVDANADALAMSANAALADTQPALTVPACEGSTLWDLAEAGVSLPAKLAGLLQPSLGAVAVTAGNFDVLAGLTTAPALSEMSLGTDEAFAVDLLLLRPVDLDVLPLPL